MAVHSLTLAALATSAVPGLEVTGFSQITKTPSGRVSALFQSSFGVIKVSYPDNISAEATLSKEILCLSALTESARTFLNFEIPKVLGIVAFQESRAVVTTNPIGRPLNLIAQNMNSFASQISTCVAAIHELPVQIVLAEGLPVFSVSEIRESLLKKLDLALETGLLPETLNDHWRTQIRDDSLWDFTPAVVHAALDEDMFIVSDNSISGILGWSELQVSDPALDFVWLSGTEIEGAVIDHYLKSFKATNVSVFKKRLKFWQEFEMVNWLLHGVETRDNDIKHDAVLLFDNLVDVIKAQRLNKRQDSSFDTSDVPPLSVDTAYEEIPEIVGRSSDTAVIESLEEDKFFTDEAEFIDEPEFIDELESSLEPENTAEAENKAHSENSVESERAADSVDDDSFETVEIDTTSFKDN